MSTAVRPKERVHRILKGLRCFWSPVLRHGESPPQGVAFSPGEECLGGIWGSTLESILTDCGAYFVRPSGWAFVAYGDIEEVVFPDKSDPDGSLTLRTPIGDVELLAGRSELWDVGRFFMRCREDANAALIGGAGSRIGPI
jgi:hypothetical protein